ncbi:MAG: aldolase, partial [Actinobacteria bacterium]|nr:aldolase [Actinomycetota bacterium]
RVRAGHLSFDAQGAIIPHPIVAAYALTACQAGQAKRVLLAGFDGYSEGDPRHIMMQETIDHFSLKQSSIPLVAVTRSSYRIAQRSLFAPL